MVVKEYRTEHAIVRIHDDYLVTDEKEKEKILDRLWAFHDRVMLRKFAKENATKTECETKDKTLTDVKIVEGEQKMREKANYREMLSFLINEKQCPLTFTKKAAAEFLGISRGQLDIIIAKGGLKLQDGRIPIGSIASYLCG